MTRFALIAALAFATLLLATPAGAAEPAEKAAAAKKFDSPQAVFDAAKAALEERQWKAFCGTMTGESQDLFAGMMAFMGQMMRGMAEGFAALAGEEAVKEIQAKMKPVTDVMEKHKLTKEKLKALETKLAPKQLSNEAAMKEALTKIAPLIHDKPAFVADMMTAFHKIGEEEGRDMSRDMNLIAKDAKLKDVKQDGDAAQGTIVTTKDGEEKSDPIHFKKVDGGWLIDLTKMPMKG